MAKQLIYDFDARRKMEKGAAKMSGATRVTLGPTGHTVLVEKSFGAPVATKDGVTVAKELELPDPFENMGAKLINEVAEKTSSDTGDGTTTAMLLAEAIYREGLKYITSGVNPMALRRGIEQATGRVVEGLEGVSRPVEGKKDYERVATISANEDIEVGKMIAQAMAHVGKEGAITVEEGKGLGAELELVEGIQFDKGYSSPHFVNKAEHLTCEMEDALVLVHEKKIANVRDFLPILEKVAGAGKPLLLVCEEVEGEALAALVINRLRGVLACCAVKAPAFGDRRKAILQDIAVLTGATFVSEELGLKLESLELAQLGKAGRVVVEKEKTTIVKGGGKRKAIDERIAQVRTQLKETTSDYDREKLEERLAKLVGGVAVIHVGAPTEAAMKERKGRVEDAVHATQAAGEEGLVPGGGTTLLRLQERLDAMEPAGDDEAFGVRVVRKALEQPLRWIARNSGLDEAAVLGETRSRPAPHGLNAATGKYGDLLAMGIVDPTKVVRVGLQNAASVAALMLTSQSLVTDLKEKKKPVPGSVS